jgi:hypothetical protein
LKIGVKMGNSSLNKAREVKNDEFFTRLEDIEKEMWYYRDHFRNKSVYLNCDDPEKSNFWKFFKLKFDLLGLSKLTSTCHNKSGGSYKLEVVRGVDEDEAGYKEVIKTGLVGNGDFRSDECIELLKECDIVVTNPPFSLFRKFIDQLMRYNKKFLIIGSMNAITYTEVFKHIKPNKIWLGINPVKEFIKPDGGTQKFGNILWYTNLEHYKRNKELVLNKEYDPELYPTYDNYNAIEVGQVVNIPNGYEDIMGVPISYLTKHNPTQFHIVGCSTKQGDECVRKEEDNRHGNYLHGMVKYKRLFIKRRERK